MSRGDGFTEFCTSIGAELLDSEQVALLLARALEQPVFDTLHDLNDLDQTVGESIEDLDDPAVRQMLRSYADGLGPDVDVFWIADRFGARLAYSTVVDYFDDLWYPSSDDVVVFSIRSDAALVVGHEERVKLLIDSRGPAPRLGEPPANARSFPMWQPDRREQPRP